MIGPLLQRDLSLRHLRSAIIDAGDASPRARNVVQTQFNDVGRRTDLGHSGCAGAPKIVEPPRRNVFHPRVELRFSFENPLTGVF